jgi:branched-chain amino acid transport system permease protein
MSPPSTAPNRLPTPPTMMATKLGMIRLLPIGGVGSLFGAVLGGLIIGLAAGITTTYYPAASEAVIYLMMLIVLVVRPRGLFGEEGLFE